MTKCSSKYTVDNRLVLHCNGEHLRGNIMQGEVHQTEYGGLSWTWYDHEADKEA